MSSHASRRHLRQASPAASPAATPAASPAATPAAGPVISSGEITVVATGLANPRGFTWGSDGLLYVALAGDGDTPPAKDGVAAPPRPGAPPSVVRIEADGSITPIVTGLPSTQDPYADVMGPVDVAFFNDQLYILHDATGGVEEVGLKWPNGLYALDDDGTLRLVSSQTVFVVANKPEHVYHEVELGEPFAMVVDEDGFWILDANRGLLVHLLPEGTGRVVADLSLDHPVPTAIAHSPDGNFYVGYLGPGPHTDGEQKVVKVTRDGEISDYLTGLAMVTGIAVGADGVLYALDMSTGNTTDIHPKSGRLVRQTGPQSFDEVVTGLDYPISMAFGPDGGLYISGPAIATDGATGHILRIDAAAGETLRMPESLSDLASAYPQKGASA